jgi:hypothetical protein
MDAMQKRRMWKVALVHFGATLICGVTLITTLAFFPELADYPLPNFPLSNAAKFLWLFFEPTLFVLLLLQPQFFIASIFNSVNFESAPLFCISLGLVFYFISIPIWSICFGWLFVKFDNWLNHFPVLGKKVF